MREISVVWPQVKKAARRWVVVRVVSAGEVGGRYLELRAAPTGAPIHHFTCAEPRGRAPNDGASSDYTTAISDGQPRYLQNTVIT
jgi:hypothetical protein